MEGPGPQVGEGGKSSPHSGAARGRSRGRGVATLWPCALTCCSLGAALLLVLRVRSPEEGRGPEGTAGSHHLPDVSAGELGTLLAF